MIMQEIRDQKVQGVTSKFSQRKIVISILNQRVLVADYIIASISLRYTLQKFFKQFFHNPFLLSTSIARVYVAQAYERS